MLFVFIFQLLKTLKRLGELPMTVEILVVRTALKLGCMLVLQGETVQAKEDQVTSPTLDGCSVE